MAGGFADSIVSDAPHYVPRSAPAKSATAFIWGRYPPRVLTLEELDAARARVSTLVPPTPAIRWPLLEQVTGAPTWVKHENHTATGAFKVRGGVNFLARLRREHPECPGLVSATRGNHGQSIALAGRAAGLSVTIVVPEGNSPDKNAAMEAFGAELVVHGRDFQEAREHSVKLAEQRALVPVPAFHPWLVEGVATYAAELHAQARDLDVLYVPVGMGSGICANIAVRDLLELDCEIVGVVAKRAPAYALSFDAGEPVSTESADTFVDGVACRTPDPDALITILAGASRFVQVPEKATRAAMRTLFSATHNLPEPAGAIGLAGRLADPLAAKGQRVGLVLTGGNADWSVLRSVMEEVPER